MNKRDELDKTLLNLIIEKEVEMDKILDEVDKIITDRWKLDNIISDINNIEEDEDE